MKNHTLQLHLYRDLSNREAGEPDDGAMAWSAHFKRLKVIQQISEDTAFDIKDWGQADDEERPHELAEVLVEIVQDPTVQSALMGAAIYAGKVVAAQIDELLGRGVEKLLDRLFKAFKQEKTGDFWIRLPDGSKIQVSADANVTINIRDGKTTTYHVDSPPS